MSPDRRGPNIITVPAFTDRLKPFTESAKFSSFTLIKLPL